MKKLLLVLGIILVACFAWYRLSLRPADSANDVRQPVTIEQGLSVAGIGTLLEEKGIVRSARAFSLYARLHGAQTSLQAGNFILRPSMSTPDVINALKKGYSEEITLTIPEGFTVGDIDALLVNNELVKPEEFIVCAQTCDLTGFSFLPTGKNLAARGGRLEGYLFPDTYFIIRDGFTPQSFMTRLLETFRKRVIDGLAKDVAVSGRSLHQIVTMASLIEEETRSDDERAIVSGILWKRFTKKMGLDVDASMRYILEKPTAALTEEDLKIDSPYNLRKYRGLPPGPIANPGLKSIQAALHPENSKYWYYLHGKDGAIHYAETNEEHNRNKELYLN